MQGDDDMKDGYVRIATASFHTSIGNYQHNANQIIKQMEEAYANNTNVLLFPELSISGYTCEDLFYQDRLLNGCIEQLERIMNASLNKQMITIVGLPFEYKSRLYNVAALIYQGKILGIVPKTHIPNYHEFYEARHFAASFEDNVTVELMNQTIPFGNKLIFINQQMPSMGIGIEICEDLWVSEPPSGKLAKEGALIITNLSCSNELVGKSSYRNNLVSSQSARCIVAYAYCNGGTGESSTDVVFSSHQLIYENGRKLMESPLYLPGIHYADIDLDKLRSERRKIMTYQTTNNYQHVYFSMDKRDISINRFYDPHPFVPNDITKREQRCKEVITIQAMGLKQRLEATNIKKAVIGISGGLDSTLALLVTQMAFDLLDLPRNNIHAITMPCFGTTKRTKDNALGIMESLGVTYETIDITKSVLQHFKDIKQDKDLFDVTYENAQARERTQVLMDKANQIGGIVIGTGDLSEIALGWSTYNGDHMSMYAVNCSIPKTLVRYLISYFADTQDNKALKNYLNDILDTPVSPELLPVKENEITQKTEEIVGPYELHDFFLYHAMRFNLEPRKLLRIALIAFHHQYDKETIIKWMKVFYRRFISQQFKRSCIPDGPKVGTVALSPRGDLRMPSDASYEMFLQEIDKL